MNYKYSITSKGQITISKGLREMRSLLNKPTFKDKTSEKEQTIGTLLKKQYLVK